MLLLLLYCIGASSDDAIFSRFAETFTSNPTLIGILASTGWITYTLMSGPAGGVVGRIGIKKAVLMGGILDSIGFLLIYASTSTLTLVIAMIVNGIGSAFFWAASRVHVANTSYGKTGMAFGLYSASWSIGWALGPVVGGLMALVGGIRAPFLMGAAVLMAITLIIVQIIPDDGNKRKISKAIMYEIDGGFLKDIKRFLKTAPPGVKRLLFLQAMEYAILEMILVFSPLYFTQLNYAEIGALFFMQSIIFAAGSIFWGRMADKMMKHMFVVSGFVVSGIIIFSFLNVSNFILMGVLMGTLGLALALVEPISDAMLNDMIKPKDRGIVNGVSSTAFGTGASLGPIIAGVGASYFGISGIFIMAALLCGLGGIIAFTLGFRKK